MTLKFICVSNVGREFLDPFSFSGREKLEINNDKSLIVS